MEIRRSALSVEKIYLLIASIIIIFPVAKEYSGEFHRLYLVVALISFLMLAIPLLAKPSVTRMPLLRISVVIFLIIPMVSFFVGLYQGNDVLAAFGDLAKYMNVLFVYFITARLVYTGRLQNRRIAVYLGAFLLMMFIYLAYMYASASPYDLREYKTNVVIKNYIYIPALLILGLLVIKKKKYAFLYYTVVLVLSLFTFSRTLIVQVLLLGALLLCAACIRFKLIASMFIGSALLLPIVYLIISFSSFIEIDKSMDWRFYEISIALAHINMNFEPSHYVFGEGFGYYLQADTALQTLFGETYDELGNLHNLWVFIFLKQGIIGILTLVLAVVLIVFKVIRTYRHDVMLFVILYALMLQLFWQGNYFGGYTQHAMYGISIGILFGLLDSRLAMKMNAGNKVLLQ